MSTLPSDMLCAVWHGRNDLRLERHPVPIPGSREVLVRVVACGTCATDLHLIDGSIPLYQPPRIPGHEVGGQVIALGSDVRSLSVDDAVALDTSLPCDMCFYCRDGRPFLCSDRTPTFAGWAEYVLAPERLTYRLPPGLPAIAGALAEPISCCLHALDMSPLRAGSTAAVVGAGAIGLLLTQLLHRSGVSRLLVSDPEPTRRAQALAVGASHVVDPTQQDVALAARDMTDGLGVDLAFEAVGAAATLEAAVSLPRRGGTVVLVGVAPGDAVASVRPYELFARELTIRASAMRAFEFDRAVRLLAELDLAPFTSCRVPLSEIHRALDLSRQRAAPKVLVCP